MADHPSDVPGCGLTSYEDRCSSPSVDDCRAQCAADMVCNSINWGANWWRRITWTNVCTLYNVDSPTVVHGPKQFFLQMGPDPTFRAWVTFKRVESQLKRC